ncbi:MAG TPA: RNA-directed DNA polymerase [Candidatus Paceibacterota bacterium]|nr:RNA-directed DNA polymerase [Candidatus Paceibacterota bacterium]
MNEKEFKEICLDKGFWRHNLKDTLIPYTSINKERLINNLYIKIKSREYYPSPPQNYLISNKGNQVLRVIPVFKLEDLCVYFYCTRKLEKYIAKNRVEGTYGGWSLNGETKIEEEVDLSSYDKEFISVQEFEGDYYTFIQSGEYEISTNFNPQAWAANWGDFTNKIYKYSVDDYVNSYVAELDIANFYDSVRLDHLEYIIRSNIESKDNEVVYLLFHFLKYWNRHNNFYVHQNAGLPQDLFGECSRILANFYLQSYDKKMKELCDKLGAKYFRYADDQVVFAKSTEVIKNIIARSSSYLMRIGLNLNQKKVHVRKKSEFNNYFAFEILMQLGGSNNVVSSKNIDKAIEFYLKNKQDLRSGGRTLVRAILSSLKKADGKMKKIDDLIKFILTKDFLVSHPPDFKDYKKIYSNIDTKQKKYFLALLKDITKECLHTDFLFHHKRFLASQAISYKFIQKHINRVNNIYNLKI